MQHSKIRSKALSMDQAMCYFPSRPRERKIRRSSLALKIAVRNRDELADHEVRRADTVVEEAPLQPWPLHPSPGYCSPAYLLLCNTGFL